MFIECQTISDKSILYNVNNIVFIGDMKDKVSILFDDGTFYQISDEYNSIVKKIIELSRLEPRPLEYIQFTTNKEERISFSLRRVFYILEQESTTAIMFIDGTRIELLEDFSTVAKRVLGRFEYAVEQPKSNQEIKS